MRGKKRASLLQPARPAETTIFTKIVETLEKHHLPRPSEMVERFKFHSRYCKVDEGVATYVAASCKLSGHCNYGETLLEMLRDRLVCSVNNEKIQQRLLAELDLTLKKAEEIALAIELVSVMGKFTDFSVCLFGRYLRINFSCFTISDLFKFFCSS